MLKNVPSQFIYVFHILLKMKQYFAFSCGTGYGYGYRCTDNPDGSNPKYGVTMGYNELGDELVDDLRKKINDTSGTGIGILINGLTETFPIPIEVNRLQEEQFQSIRTSLRECITSAEERQT